MHHLGLVISIFCVVAVGATESEIVTEAPKNYRSPLRAGLDLSYSPVYYKSYDWINGIKNETKGHGLRMSIEWIPFGQTLFGKPMIGVGTGFTWMSKAQLDAATRADLYTLPIKPYLGYRLSYFQDQPVVPYAKAGVNYTLVHQETKTLGGSQRASDKNYFGFDYALGLELCLNLLDRRSIRNLENSTGINSVSVYAEYANSRQLEVRSADLSHEEVMAGMRFEF